MQTGYPSIYSTVDIRETRPNEIGREPDPPNCVLTSAYALWPTRLNLHTSHTQATVIINVKKKKPIGLESTMFKFQTPSVTHPFLGPNARWLG